MADGYSVLTDYGSAAADVIPEGDAAAKKALELDPTLGHPHAVLAASKAEYYWDFAGSEAEYRNAIELDPSDSTAHQWFSEDFGGIGGHAQEAIKEANLARQLDPLSPIMGAAQVEDYTAAGQFDKAIEIGQRSIAENPTFGAVHAFLGRAYWAERKYPETLLEYKTAAQLMGDKNHAEITAAMETGYRSSGWQAALRKAIEVSLAQRKAKNGYVAPSGIAELYADLGDKDRAFEWLNTAYQERDFLLSNIRTDFPFDSLRSDPRYAELVRKIGLPR